MAKLTCLNDSEKHSYERLGAKRGAIDERGTERNDTNVQLRAASRSGSEK